MAFKPSLTIANFICRFGDQKVLLDLFREIVYPAFFDSGPRSYGKSSKNSLFLFDLKLADLGSNSIPEPVIAGRFVRDMDLTRSHVLRDDKLVPNPAEMESATSARFVLILSSHTLLYVPETPYAPSLGTFRSTIQFHLSKAWSKYIKSEARRKRKLDPRGPTIREITLALMEEVPRPELNIHELPGHISIRDFLQKFQKINRVEYRIDDTNHTTDFLPLVEQLRTQKQATESDKIIIVERNPKNIPALSKQLHGALRDGNVNATITGKAVNGGTISGSNEEFRLLVPLGNVPQSMNGFIKSIFIKFRGLVDGGEVRVQRPGGVAEDKLRVIADSSERLND